jgi:serine/threonine-protein kinase RsbW
MAWPAARVRPSRDRRRDARDSPRLADHSRRPEQVATARAFVARTLSSHQVGADNNAATLLTSEIVTNAVQHTKSGVDGGTVTIVVIRVPYGVLVEIIDDGSAGTPVVKGDLYAAEGHGLFLVQHLAAQWATSGTRPAPRSGSISRWPTGRSGPRRPPNSRRSRRPGPGLAVRITSGRPSSGPRRYSPPPPDPVAPRPYPRPSPASLPGEPDRQRAGLTGGAGGRSGQRGGVGRMWG